MIAGAALRPTRTRYAVLLFVYFAAFITYLDRVCISVATPAMQRDLGLSEIQFAWVFTVFYIAYGVFEMPTAWLGDRWGQRRMLIRIVGCWSLFTVFTGMARSLPMLLMTRTVFGAAEAGAFPTLSRALSRWFPMHERGRANGIMWMGARSGGALAPPIAVAMITLIGWRSRQMQLALSFQLPPHRLPVLRRRLHHRLTHLLHRQSFRQLSQFTGQRPEFVPLEVEFALRRRIRDHHRQPIGRSLPSCPTRSLLPVRVPAEFFMNIRGPEAYTKRAEKRPARRHGRPSGRLAS